MTDLEINELLYSQASFEEDGYLFDSWFDTKSGEKIIAVVNQKTKEETDFVANGMTCDELKEKLLYMLA